MDLEEISKELFAKSLVNSGAITRCSNTHDLVMSIEAQGSVSGADSHDGIIIDLGPYRFRTYNLDDSCAEGMYKFEISDCMSIQSSGKIPSADNIMLDYGKEGSVGYYLCVQHTKSNHKLCEAACAKGRWDIKSFQSEQ